jgi:hypothetical protein
LQSIILNLRRISYVCGVRQARWPEKYQEAACRLGRLVDRVGDEDVVDSVGDPARIELVLPIAMIFAECHPVIIATRTSG